MVASPRRPQIDDRQRLARIAVGIELPRAARPREKRVAGVLPIECRKCGCTGAHTVTEDYTCAFCGTVTPKLRIAARSFLYGREPDEGRE